MEKVRCNLNGETHLLVMTLKEAYEVDLADWAYCAQCKVLDMLENQPLGPSPRF